MNNNVVDKWRSCAQGSAGIGTLAFRGQGVLVLLAGSPGDRNGVLRMFDFLLRPVRAVADRLLARIPLCRRDLVSFLLLLILWFGLGVSKFFLAAS